MVFTTQKQTFYGNYITDYTTNWGGITYNTYLFDYTVNPDFNYNDTTDNDIIRYIMPFSPGNAYVIDGIVEGFFTVYNADSGTASTFNSYTVALKKTKDVSSSEESLGSMTHTFSSETIAAEGYGIYPIYFDVEHEEVLAEEELLLLYLNMDFTDGDLEWSHANDSSNVDLEVKIPFP